MNRSKGFIALGLAVIFIVVLTACGGKSTPPAPPAQLVVVTNKLPQAAVNTPYTTYLSATGGTGSYTWCVFESSGACDNGAGVLPPGLTMNTTSSVISGTPTTGALNYPFKVQVTDGAGTTATANLALYVEGAVIITPAGGPLPTGSVGVWYPYPAGTGVQLSVAGGKPPYTWTVSSGSLPAGLSLNPNSGLISGIPTTNGPPLTFTVQASDSELIPATGTVTYKITVLTITTTSLPPADANVPYSTTLTASGGSGKYTWCLVESPTLCDNPVNSPLLAGLGLSTSGVISGTATVLGQYPFTTMVCDSQKPTPACAVPASLTLSVQFAITTIVLPQGTVNLAYNTTLAASGGTPPYTWCALESGGACDDGTGGALPAGLSLSGGGVISGTPTTQGTSNFTVQATDSTGNISTAPLSIIINPAITNSNLSGSYAFTFSGYKNGSLVVMAGAFVANGDGTFKAVQDSQGMICGAVEPLSFTGCLDYNNGGGETGGSIPVPQRIVAATSSYSIQPNGLGTMTFLTDLGNTFNFSVSIKGDGSGTLIEDNADPNERGSGLIKKQTPADFGIGSLNATFAVGFFGTGNQTPPERYAGAGVFRIINGQGDIDCSTFGSNGCPADVDDGGSLPPTAFLGTFSTSIDTNVGRGNFVNLTFNKDQAHTFVYAYYIVSHNELILVSTNSISSSTPYPLTMWSARRQLTSAGGFNNSTLTGTDVQELTALDTNGAADVSAGLFVGHGVSGNNCQGSNYDPATFSFDENQGGTSSLQQSSTGTYCVDKITGRVTLTPFNVGPFAVPPVFYMIAAGQGYVVGTDPAVTSGYFEPQTGSPFANSSITGPHTGGTITPAIPVITDAATWLSSDGSSNISGSENTSGPGGPGGPTNFAWTYSVDSTGRTTVQQNLSTAAIMYVVSPTKVVMVPVLNLDGSTDTSPALSIFQSSTTN